MKLKNGWVLGKSMALFGKFRIVILFLALILPIGIVLGETSRDNALNELLSAKSGISTMQDSDLSVYFVNDTLLSAERFFIGENVSLIKGDLKTETNPDKVSYLKSLLVVSRNTPIPDIEHLDYSEVIRLTQLIHSRKELAFELIDKSTLVENHLKESESLGIDISNAKHILIEVRTAIVEERYDDATTMIATAEKDINEKRTYQSRLNEAIRSGTSFFIRNWWQILLITGLFSVIITPIVKIIRKRVILMRIKKLKLEQDVLLELMKRAQKDYLVNMNISKETYNSRVKDYKTRIAEIKSKLPVLEASIGKKKNNPDGNKLILFKRL